MRVALSIILLIVAVATTLYFFADDVLPVKPETAAIVNKQTPEQPDQSAADKDLIQEAEQYLDEITNKADDALNSEDMNGFVTREQTISLGESTEIQTLSVDDLTAAGIDGDSAITVVKQQQQIVYKSPSEILLNARGDKEQAIKYLVDGTVTESTVGKLLEEYSVNELENIPVLVETDDYVITTPNELRADSSIDHKQALKIITKPYRLPTTSIAELLMGDDEPKKDDIFYVRNIDDSDQSGIWGIVQDGLLKNFAQGIAIKRGENYENYQVLIPSDADEQLADQSSSFLGRLIHDKSQKSYVYNVEKGKMGRNPDLIYPGQEIVIIQFTSEELIEIYQHFVAGANS